MLVFLIALLAAVQLEPPRTVNDQILGTAEDFTTVGPSRVCMDGLMVTAVPEESVSLNYAGIHWGVLRLNRGKSWVDASLGDTWAQPQQRGEVIERRTGSYIADVSDNETLKYGVFAPDELEGEYRLVARIEGPALTGDERDRFILRRIEIRGQQSPACDVTYHYGWNMLFGKEPLVEPTK